MLRRQSRLIVEDLNDELPGQTEHGNVNVFAVGVLPAYFTALEISSLAAMTTTSATRLAPHSSQHDRTKRRASRKPSAAPRSNRAVRLAAALISSGTGGHRGSRQGDGAGRGGSPMRGFTATCPWPAPQ